MEWVVVVEILGYLLHMLSQQEVRVQRERGNKMEEEKPEEREGWGGGGGEGVGKRYITDNHVSGTRLVKPYLMII